MIETNARADLLEECEDQHVLSDNRSPIILLKIAGMEFPALVDSGSQVSCLSREVWDQMKGRTDMPILPVTGVRISEAFQAKPRRVTHEALITFQAAEQEFQHRCLTVETPTGRVRILEATHQHQQASGESVALFISSTWMPAGLLSLCTLAEQCNDKQRFNLNLDGSKLTGSQRERLNSLLRQYDGVFSEKPGRVKSYEHTIEVMGKA